MLILVVEDDVRVARFVVKGLREEGHQVDLCEDGEVALVQGASQPYDVILLDWMLPGRDGLSVLRHWRQSGVTAPVIMLTARIGEDPTILALNEGADDFVEKPFSFEVLLARIRAVTRRTQHEHAQGGKIALGAVQLDPHARIIERPDGTKQDLSAREFSLLDFLLKHRGEVLTRSRILDRVWGMHHDPTTNVVDVYIRYLRQKIDAEGCSAEQSIIETVRGRGYRLRPQEDLQE
jgi:two-component system OmpR family response regulator